MLPCHTQDNFHFSPSTHIYNQDDNDESILSLFWGFQEYILHTKAMVNKWEVMVYILLIIINQSKLQETSEVHSYSFLIKLASDINARTHPLPLHIHLIWFNSANKHRNRVQTGLGASLKLSKVWWKCPSENTKNPMGRSSILIDWERRRKTNQRNTKENYLQDMLGIHPLLLKMYKCSQIQLLLLPMTTSLRTWNDILLIHLHKQIHSICLLYSNILNLHRYHFLEVRPPHENDWCLSHA